MSSVTTDPPAAPAAALAPPDSPAPHGRHGSHDHPGHPGHHVPWLSYLSLAASTSVIGSYVGLSKLLVLVFPVFLLAFLRFGMAAVFMLPWLRRGPAEAPLSRRTRWLLFLESFFGNFLFSICLLFGMKHSSAVVAGVIMAGIPATVALMSWLFLRERIAPRTLAGIAMAVGGIALVATAPARQPRAGARCCSSARCAARPATSSSASA